MMLKKRYFWGSCGSDATASGRIKRIVDVPVPHLRKREDVRLHNIKNNILFDFSDPLKDQLNANKPAAKFSDYQFAW